MDLEQAFRVRPSTGSFIKKNSITWTPASCTGIPNKYYRGPQQVLPGSPTSIFVRWPTACDDNPHKHAEVRPCLTLQGPCEGLPGSPTSATGVPNKYYRGPQQVAPAKHAAKRCILGWLSASLCFCFSCSVMLLNNNYRENGEVCQWGPVASS